MAGDADDQRRKQQRRDDRADQPQEDLAEDPQRRPPRSGKSWPTSAPMTIETRIQVVSDRRRATKATSAAMASQRSTKRKSIGRASYTSSFPGLTRNAFRISFRTAIVSAGRPFDSATGLIFHAAPGSARRLGGLAFLESPRTGVEDAARALAPSRSLPTASPANGGRPSPRSFIIDEEGRPRFRSRH